MKTVVIITLLAVAIIGYGFYSYKFNPKPIYANGISNAMQSSIHQFKVNSLDGGVIDFSLYKGKKILVVNTASKCGYTPQYKELQSLCSKYQKKLVIVGFPCNQFGEQEPGNSTEIKEFCTKNYGVTFPIASKIDVKGENMAPIYKWLCNKSENGVLNATIKWNFNKFLLDEKGYLLAYFGSSTSPESTEILNLIDK